MGSRYFLELVRCGVPSVPHFTEFTPPNFILVAWRFFPHQSFLKFLYTENVELLLNIVDGTEIKNISPPSANGTGPAPGRSTKHLQRVTQHSTEHAFPRLDSYIPSRSLPDTRSWYRRGTTTRQPAPVLLR